MEFTPFLTFPTTILILVLEKQKIVNQSDSSPQRRKDVKGFLFNLKFFAAWPPVAKAMARQASLRENKLKWTEFLNSKSFSVRFRDKL